MIQDSWFTRHVRPMVSAFLTVVYSVGFLKGFDITPLNPVMLLMFGFYFTSRGVEKVMSGKQ